MNWLQYLAEANLYLAVFYLCYILFLKGETHYALNRAYLLCTSVISFVLPVVQLGILKPAEAPVRAIVSGSPVNVHPGVLQVRYVPAYAHFDMQDALLYAYLLGVFVMTIAFAIKVYQLYRLTRVPSVTPARGYKLIYIEGTNTAFSFFGYLFIGAGTLQPETVIRHELVHIRQKHSVDILLLEIIKIISWFNPLVYLMPNTFKALHEYIADEKTAAFEPSALAYSSFLVSNLYGLSGSSITHSFFNYNLLKNRISMLHQKRSGNLARLKYLIILPICAGLLCASTLAFSKTYDWVDIAPKAPVSAKGHLKIKTLKSTEGRIIGYGDKMTIHGKTYTVNTLNKTDQLYLLKTYGIKLDVVEIAGKPGQATVFFPAGNAKDTTRYSVKARYTAKGYKFTETGYSINGKSNFRVIITEKNGEEKAYFKNSATPAQIAMLKDKYGYTFPSMEIFTKMPPPPPMPPAHPSDPKVKLAKLPPPIIKRDTAVPAKPDAPVKPVEPKMIKPTPPPPIPPKEVKDEN